MEEGLVNDDGQHTLDVVRRPPVIARHGTGVGGCGVTLYTPYREIRTVSLADSER